MALPVSSISQTLADYGSETTAEKSTWKVYVATMTAANATAQIALHDALYAAIDAINIGVQSNRETVFSRASIAGAHATTKLSQRENKFLIRYRGDANFKAYNVSIPCADLSLLATDQEFLDPDGAPYIALKAAFEAVVRSPDDATETVTMGSVQFVGANL